MLRELVLCWVVCGGAADELLAALGGVNQLVVCVAPREPNACPAALWRPRWIVARASCLADHPLAPLRVIRATRPYTCAAYRHSSWKAWWSRGVESRSVHPHWAAGGRPWDLALLALDAPLGDGEPPANVSAARGHLAKFELWMEAVSEEEWSVGPARRASLSDDTLLLLWSTLVPGAAFCAFFLFVTFCTGTPIKAPYVNVDKPPVVTPLTQYPHRIMYHPKGNKCYLTYGQA